MSASSDERPAARWLVEGMHPAAAIAVYVGLAMGLLVIYGILAPVLPVAIAPDRLTASAAVLAAFLMGWHLRRVYDGGHDG